MQFIATTFENSVLGGCSTVATNVGRNGVLLAMQWQKRHPMCCYRCTQQLPAVWDDGSFIWVLYIVNDIFWGCPYELQSEEQPKIKKYDRLTGSRRCFLTARVWRLRIHHWTQAVMFKRCIMQHSLDHRSVDESHSMKMSCCHCNR